MPDRKLVVGGPPRISPDSDTAWAGTLVFSSGAAGPKTVTGLNTYIHNANTKYVFCAGNTTASILVSRHGTEATDVVTAACDMAASNTGTLTFNYQQISGGASATFYWMAFQGGTGLT